MKPQDRKNLRFPGKTKEWFGRGIRMWWEGIIDASNNRAKQTAKKEIKKEIDSECSLF